MSSVDQRIVEMQFNNQQFEKGIGTSLKSLDSLKKGLDLDKSTKSLSALQSVGDKFSLSHIASGVEAIASKFSFLGVMGVTALQRISNMAITTGERLVSALTIDPIKDGLREYETQMNAIQTILSNTRSKGTTIDDVNKSLDELNAYSDKTIYNFSEMAKNIGTFTAAGSGLKESTAAIKGIANLGAVSGSSSMQVSTAMYQLSQALSTGTVRLMDWNSVVNAGMGGEVFQNAIKETARVHGVEVDAIIKKQGSFRDSLQEGWLTSSILMETLSKFTGDLSKEEIIAMGYTADQADEIIVLGKDASDAATKVKTFTQLISTLKEALGSGWAQSWENIIGNFEEARTLWTSVNDALSGIITKNAQERNDLLAAWRDAGGRADLIQGLTDIFGALWSVVVAIGDAMDDVFPDATVDNLLAISKGVKDFGERLKTVLHYKEQLLGTPSTSLFTSVAGSDTSSATTLAEELKKGSKGEDVTALQKRLIEAGYGVGTAGADGIFGKDTEAALKKFQEDMGVLSDGTYNTETHTKLLEKLGITGDEGGVLQGLSEYTNIFSDSLVRLQKIFGGIFSVVKIFGKALGFAWDVLNKVGGALSPLGDAFLTIFAAFGDETSSFNTWLDDSKTFSNWLEKVDEFLIPVGEWAQKAADALLEFFGLLEDGGDGAENKLSFSKIWSGISSGIKKLFSGIDWVFDTISGWVKLITDLGILGGGGLIGLILGAIGVSQVVKVVKSFKKVADGISGVADVITGKASLFSRGEKISTVLLKFAVAIGLVVLSLYFLGTMNTGQMVQGLIGIAIIMGLLIGFKVALDKLGAGKVKVKSLISIGLALLIFAGIAKILGGMETGELVRGLLGIAGIMALLIGFKWAMNKLGTSGVKVKGLFSIAIAIGILALITKLIGEMRNDEVIRGLLGIAGIMTLLVVFKFAMNKLGASGVKVKGLFSIAIAIGILALIVGFIGNMRNDQVVRGLLGIAGIMALLVVFKVAMNKLGASTVKVKGLFSIAIAIGILALIVGFIGNMRNDQVIRGLLGIAGIMALLVIFKVAMNKLGASDVKVKGLLSIAIAIGILAFVTRLLGEMRNDEVIRGLLGIAGIMVLLVAFKWSMNKLGASTVKVKGLLSIAVAIGILAVITRFLGEMETGQILRGLLGIAGIMALLLVFKWGMDKVGASGVKVKGLFSIAIAMAILSACIKVLGEMKTKDLAKGVVTMAAIMALLIGFKWAMGKLGTAGIKVKGLLSIAVAFAILSVVMLTFGFVMKSLKNVDPKAMLSFAIAISAIILSFVAAAAIANAAGGLGGMISGALALGAAITILLAIIAGIVIALGAIDIAFGGGLVKILERGAKVLRAIGKAIGSLIGGIKEGIFGESDLNSYAKEVEGYGTALSTFAGATDGVTAESIQGAIDASTLLSKFVNGLPKMGGVVGWWEGDQDFGQFSKDLLEYAKAIASLGPAVTIMAKNKSIVSDTRKAIEVSKVVHEFFSTLEMYPIEIYGFEGYVTAAAQLSTDMNLFGIGIRAFAAGVAGLGNSQTIDNDTAKAISIATIVHGFFSSLKLLPVDVGALKGYNTAAATLSTDMKLFAVAIKTFASNVAGLSEKKSLTDDTNTAISTAQTVHDFFVSLLPTTIDQTYLKNYNAAAEGLFVNMTKFGTAISDFQKAISGISKTSLTDDTATAVEAAKAVKKFIDDISLVKIDPETEALDPWVDAAGNGTTTDSGAAGTLFDNITSFGKSMSDLSAGITGLSDSTLIADLDTAKNMATTIKNFLANLKINNTQIEKDKGALQLWIGEDTAANTLIDNIKDLGSAFQTAQSGFTGLSSGTFIEDVRAMKQAMHMITALFIWIASEEVVVHDQAKDTYYYDTFHTIIDQMELLANAIKTFDGDTTGVDTAKFTTLAAAVMDITDSVVALGQYEGLDAITTFKTTISDLYSLLSPSSTEALDSSKFTEHLDGATVSKAITDFAVTVGNALSGETDYLATNMESFNAAGSSLAKTLSDGISSGASDSNGVSNLISAMLSTANGFRDDFESTGHYLGLGLPVGLYRSAKLAVIAAKAVIKAMIQAAREEALISSPSGEFEDIGMYSDLGLAKGLWKYAKVVTSASVGVAKSSIETTKNTLSKLASVVASDVDSNPVIRPVVDLSNVTSGAKAINGMMNARGSIAVDAVQSKKLASSVNSTSAGSRKNQNGSSSGSGTNSNTVTNPVNISGNFYVRSEQDIRSLASEIAALKNQQNRALGAPLSNP